MPHYSTTRKTRTSQSAKSVRRDHSRECMAKQVTRKTDRSKESIREVTLKLMALMKAKRECTSPAR